MGIYLLFTMRLTDQCRGFPEKNESPFGAPAIQINIGRPEPSWARRSVFYFMTHLWLKSIGLGVK